MKAALARLRRNRPIWRSAGAASTLLVFESVLNPSAFAQDASTAPVSALASLPHDLSPWSMFINADIIVKAVMLGLAFASLVTWTIWLAKGAELAGAKRRAKRATRLLQDADNLDEARRTIEERYSIETALPTLQDYFERVASAGPRQISDAVGS